MPCQLLVLAQTSSHWRRAGHVFSVKPGGHVWGQSCVLPGWVRITVTGVNSAPADLRFMCDQWYRNITVTESPPVSGFHSTSFDIDPRVFARFPAKGLKLGFRNWVVNEGGSITSFNDSQVVADFPVGTDFPRLQRRATDQWQILVSERIWKVKAPTVSQVVANGGTETYNRNQFNNRIDDTRDTG